MPTYFMLVFRYLQQDGVLDSGKVTAVMNVLARFSAISSLSIVCICACKAGTQAPTQLTTINGAQGGKIVYGTVAGATTQPAAMSKLLSMVHTNCGEKPQIGRVFQFTGTNSVGVFFTVTDHPEGNIPLAGLVIATATGPNQVQAAMIYDTAARFGTTANPMLQQLFSAWNPGGTPAARGGTPGAGPASASAPAGAGVALPPMRQVTLPDGTAALSLPAGWNIVPNESVMGQTTVTGPQGELLGLNYGYNAEDPNNRAVQNQMRMGIKFQNTIVYLSNADLTKSFTNVFQAMRAAMG